MKVQDAINDLIGDTVVSKDVTYKDKTRKLFFRQISGEDTDNIQLNAIGEDNKVDRKAFAETPSREIAASLCDESGNSVMNFDQVRKLPTGLRAALHAVVSEVNGVGVKKPSQIESGSGTPSPSDLEEPSVA